MNKKRNYRKGSRGGNRGGWNYGGQSKKRKKKWRVMGVYVERKEMEKKLE